MSRETHREIITSRRWRGRTIIKLACGHFRSVGGRIAFGERTWHRCLDCDVVNGDGFTPPGTVRG